MSKFTKLLLAAGFLLFLGSTVTQACSIAGATGASTGDGRPVLFKNRDAWGSKDDWKVFAFSHEATGDTFGSEDRYGDRFNFTGVGDLDSIDPASDEYYPWAGANEKGLALVQGGNHSLKANVITAQGYTPDEDTNGMDNGQLNMLILSRCETVDEVEELLRDTNAGGGWNGSQARFTTSLVMVFDRYGNMATFEVGPTDFTRDNVTAEYYKDNNGFYSDIHDDDKDLANPVDGAYSGFDWRTNFNRVSYVSANYPFFVDESTTKVIDNTVVNTGDTPDGIHDWEYSISAVSRWSRVGHRMDDPLLKDYQYMIQKNTGAKGMPKLYDIESLAKSIGNLPYDGEKPTGLHINRFATTFSVVITGSKIDDPHDGSLTTIWLAQGEPTVSVFIPIFAPLKTPGCLHNMYRFTNEKRKLVYDYDDDDSLGYSTGRNVDHAIDTQALTGSSDNGSQYYGEGGIQYPIFQSEYWAYDQYDAFLQYLRTASLTERQLKTVMKLWQDVIANLMKTAYRMNISVPDMLDQKYAPSISSQFDDIREACNSKDYQALRLHLESLHGLVKNHRNRCF